MTTASAPIYQDPSPTFSGGADLLTAGRFLTDRQLDELWAAYVANRADLRLRNRLVEHYQPWVRDLAAAIAHKMALRDPENAVGEVLAALVSTIVPCYDGKRGFDHWARVCTRRKLIDQQRTERSADTVFAELPTTPSGVSALDLLPCREQANCDLNFLEITATLSNQQATVLWLRLYRGLTVVATAALLKVSAGSVKAWTHAALVELQKQLALG